MHHKQRRLEIAKMFKWLVKLFSGKTDKIVKHGKKVVYNDKKCIRNARGLFSVVDFTGHISFDKYTECDVENATFLMTIENPSLLEENEEEYVPSSKSGNHIDWYDGIVRHGKLHCRTFQNGEFHGHALYLNSKEMGGEFKGVYLERNSLC